jgi:hypothetical protein
VIRPEIVRAVRRWAEPILAVGGTLIALWIVGGSNLRWGWLSIILGLVVLTSGALWTREAIRRVRFSAGAAGGAGRVFVEEHRLLYIGALGNVQIELSEITRVDIALSQPNGQSWVSLMLHTPGAAPAVIPLNAEGQDALIDALCTLPGFKFDALNAAIADQRKRGRFAPLVTFWRRS